MKIERIEIWPVSIPYRKPFVNSWGSFPNGDHVILRLFSEGLVGLGEAAIIMPDKGGEDQSIVVDVLQRHFGPALIGEDPFNVEGIMKKLDGFAYARYAYLVTKAAVDCALYDLMAKAAGRPVCDMLGGRTRAELEVGVALSMASPGQMAESAVAFKEKGYRFLTVKVDGRDPRLDIARLGAVREAVGAEVALDVDPNQGYSSAECIPTLRRMEAYDIAGIEQPCPAWDYDGMARVAAALDVPIAMDEGLVTPTDAHRVVQTHAADILTIKLAKSGGFSYAKRIVAIGTVGGLGFTMGSMHTFGVGTAAIHHFTASTPEVSEPIGYGSPLDRFRDDIVAEPVSVEDGRVTVPEGPGLGVELDEKKLEKYGACVEVR